MIATMLGEIDMDTELEAVKTAILKLDPEGIRTAQVLRDTFDQLYDGQRTGRSRLDQLYKTEQMGSENVVEINLHREFGFEDGKDMDYRIAGIDVDCKYSQKMNGWMIPPEAQGHLCLLVTAEDSAKPKWWVGLVRADAKNLAEGRGNRDGKKSLSKEGRDAIVWLFKDEDLPPNVLLQLDRSVVDRILGHKSGQKKINELFRNTLGLKVGRAVVATVAQQEDYMKRVRGNGGARTAMRPEGIIILGQYSSHVDIAKALGVPEPSRGESVPVRVTPAKEPGVGVAKIKESFWQVAKPNATRI
jgi:hypothetical protein